MALSDETLEQIVSNLTPEEREQLFSQLGKQIEQDKQNPSNRNDPPNKPTPKIKKAGDKVYSCVYCGSTHLKAHGITSAGNQRYICKSCNRTFTENHGSAMRYSHIDKDTWLDILRGIIHNHSTTIIADDTGLSTSTVWLCKQKVCNAIKEMYGYTDLFNGVGEADEYYCRA
ncbi:MAG: hypothetical protein NC541_07460, partial [bacterium]|nr:hypothetical protein [bacterium]